MGKHNEIGKAGEEMALIFLKKKKYKIHTINWTHNHKEIDIVAEINNIMVFVEVKTRSTLAFELPQEAVTMRKQKNIIYAADAYIQEHEITLPSRFDIISVLNGPPPTIMEHIEDAFQPNELI